MALLQNNRSGVKRLGHAETRMISMCFGVGVGFVVGGDVGAVMLALVLVLVPVLLQRAFRR